MNILATEFASNETSDVAASSPSTTETIFRFTPHFDDIDYNRHVNGSTYEKYAAHARYVMLARAGITPETMLADNLRLRPVASSMKFLRQQNAGRGLAVRTEVFRRDEVLFWDQVALGPDGEEACRLTMETVLEKDGARISFPEQVTREIAAQPDDQRLHAVIPDFNATCRQVLTPLRVRYADNNVFMEASPAMLWKYLEEGRNEFGIELGLTLERMTREGTILFTLDGTYSFGRSVTGGENLTVSTWLGQVGKMRCTMRHQVIAENGDTTMQGSETLLAVSPAKSRPVRVPEFMRDLTRDYIEKI